MLAKGETDELSPLIEFPFARQSERKREERRRERESTGQALFKRIHTSKQINVLQQGRNVTCSGIHQPISCTLVYLHQLFPPSPHSVEYDKLWFSNFFASANFRTAFMKSS